MSRCYIRVKMPARKQWHFFVCRSVIGSGALRSAFTELEQRAAPERSRTIESTFERPHNDRLCGHCLSLEGCL